MTITLGHGIQDDALPHGGALDGPWQVDWASDPQGNRSGSKDAGVSGAINRQPDTVGTLTLWEMYGLTIFENLLDVHHDESFGNAVHRVHW